ncbi:MAG TPA: hypothetical protein VJN89_08510 [Candidatus Acidoferrum sp.]|nr:hypothetical protein [Candidatus Acidoferrum sp.]
MDLNGMMTYVAALSVSTERVTEFIKRFPAFSNYLSTQKTGVQEDVRILCVHVLAIVVGGVICGFFPKTLVPTGITFPTAFWDKAAYCFFFGILASGGSGFWNSALDTLRNVKTKMAPGA